MNILMPKFDGETRSIAERLYFSSLGGKPNSAASLLRGADS
jgi:hypothetical protein